MFEKLRRPTVYVLEFNIENQSMILTKEKLRGNPYAKTACIELSNGKQLVIKTDRGNWFLTTVEEFEPSDSVYVYYITNLFETDTDDEIWDSLIIRGIHFMQNMGNILMEDIMNSYTVDELNYMNSKAGTLISAFNQLLDREVDYPDLKHA